MDRIDALKQLVKRFDENYKEYKRDTYNEHSCRDEFINPFLEILGWDVTNSKGISYFTYFKYIWFFIVILFYIYIYISEFI